MQMKRSVLIILNNTEDCELYRSMLQGISDVRYEARCIKTGDEGLAAIETEQPDCVVLDYNLPGKGSEASLSRIRARYPHLSVVILTDDKVEFDVLEAMQADGQRYIRKSEISPDALHQVVDAAILERTAEPRSEVAPTRVLIIDDNSDDRETVIRALQKVDQKYICLEAGEGTTGLKMVEESPPDCVLLDYSLPALNGLEVLSRIHSVDAFLPVIMLTGLGNETIAVEAIRSGAHNYLVKSALKPNFLHNAVASAIAHAALERKIAEQRKQIYEQRMALAESNRLNAAILDGAAYMIIATDRQGTILAFNPEAERQLGYSAAEMIGKENLLLCLDKNELVERAQTLCLGLGVKIEPDVSVLTYQASIAGGSREECTCIRRDGERFTASFAVTALQAQRGGPKGFLILGEDITARKQQHAALQAREEIFRGAMEHAPNGMAFLDITGRFLKVNEALCQMLGYTAQQLQGRHQDMVVHLEDAELDLEDARQLLAGKIQSYKVEKRLRRQDGGTVHVLHAMSLMHHPDGAPNYFVAQFQDITDRKEIERLKTDFVTTVSHELRTPLTSIRGAVGLLANVAGGELSPRGRQLIEIANKNCDRLVTLINDILDVDRMANGQMRYEMKNEDIAALLQEAIEAHRGYNDRLGVSVIMEPVQTNLIVNVDAARLIQVLFNLLSNASKHSPEGGQIRVGANRHGGDIRIWVKDQGPGIDEAFSKRIFEKYAQGDGVVRGPRGSGLGLHISKQIIEHMDGQIGLDSTLGVGSTFWIDLPAVEAASETPGEEASPRILICEDDDHLAALIQLFLAKEGFASDIVHTVPDARRKLMAGNYAAMTLDVMLPLGDGLELAREIHSHPATKKLPIVVVSGRYGEESSELQRDAGIVDWIVKPFDRDRLVRSVERAALKAQQVA